MIREQTANQFACELHERLAQKSAPERFMLGIVGYPGSGKTTRLGAIVDEYNRIAGSEQAIVVPMDGFHFSNEHLEELGLLPVKGVPETFDSFAFVSLLERLRRGESERVPRFDRTIEASIPDAIAINAEHRLLIIEGNFLLLKNRHGIRFAHCWTKHGLSTHQ